MKPSTLVVLVALLAAVQHAAADATVAASYRKDFYNSKYKESIDYPVPTDGGRVHLVLTNSSCAGTITSATVNGQAAPLPLSSNANDDPDFKYFDWARVHSDGGTAEDVALRARMAKKIALARRLLGAEDDE